MDDQELRVKCLEMALTIHDTFDAATAVEAADAFYEFVTAAQTARPAERHPSLGPKPI